jgi:maleate cis-trans isomerase
MGARVSTSARSQSSVADVLIDEGAEAIVVLGVPLAARRSLAEESAALATFTADRGAIPIISSLAASVLALQHLGVTRPLLVTQNSDAVNVQYKSLYSAAGLEPAGIVGLGAANAAQVNALSVSDYRVLAREARTKHSQADGLFVYR